jgi:hypothetical protein
MKNHQWWRLFRVSTITHMGEVVMISQSMVMWNGTRALR